MRIAIVTPTFPPYPGGIGNVAAFNATELAKLGHQVEVFTPLYEKVDQEFQGEKGKPFLTPRLGNNKSSTSGFSRSTSPIKVNRIKPLVKYGNAAFIPALHFLLKDFNIIHLHYPFFGGAETIWLYRKKIKRSGAKIVLHYHMDTVGQGIFKIIFGLSKIFFLPKIIELADKVIITSADYGKNSDVAKYLEQNPSKFFELSNGVFSNKFVPGPKDPDLLSKYNIENSDKVIMFVGGMDKAHYFKGVQYLVEAASRLRQKNYKWKLVIVGKGELIVKYKSLAAQLRISNEVIFTGYVTQEDLPKYYNLADVVVLPSIDKSEAFGLTLVEAMACAKPVIASNLVGVRIVVEEGANGHLVEPKNVDDLAAKINHILSNPDLAKQYGQVGRKKVEVKYDWTKIASELDQLYKTL